MQRRVVVTIDGPAGAGKSTVARALARRLDYRLLDTGAIYRSVALVADQRGVDWGEAEALAAIAAGLDITFRVEGEINRVVVAGNDVTDAIRQPAIAQGASKVSAHPPVRAALLELQRRLGAGGGVVVEGRDTGTVVFPAAEAKFYLTASDQVRAERRALELAAKAGPATTAAPGGAAVAQTLAEMRERDRRDTEREVAPLRPAADAIHVDSTGLSLEQVVDQLEHHVRAAATAT